MNNYAITNRAVNFLVNLFKPNKESELEYYCRSEYKKDWYAAMLHYQQYKKFPKYY